MAAYPLTVWTKRSAQRTVSNVVEDSSGTGKLLIRAIGPVRYEFNIDHRLISLADANTLSAFYLANRTALVQLTWHGTVYDCYFMESGAVINPDRGPYWRATSRLYGAPQ